MILSHILWSTFPSYFKPDTRSQSIHLWTKLYSCEFTRTWTSPNLQTQVFGSYDFCVRRSFMS